MAIKIPVEIKCLFPGYRAKWHQRYACFIAEIHRAWPQLSYGVDDDTPWLEVKGGPRLHGFFTEPANKEVYHILRDVLPEDLPLSHFRLTKDYLTRYIYPHMRPDLKPSGFPVEQMFGFHGQHKDAISDLADESVQSRLINAFQPKPEEVIIDCGCFLGFGEIQRARTTPQRHTYAVEASRDCHALLTRNLEYNNVENVTALHRAAWNIETELQLETDFAQANSLVNELLTGPRRQAVRTVTIDGLVAEFGLDRLDMLSLTLNGAEVETLEGAAETLTKLRPRIRLAGWYKRDGRSICDIAREQIEKYDYDTFIGPRGNFMALPSEHV